MEWSGSRLAREAPDVLALIEQAGPATCRATAVHVAGLALRAAGVTDPRVVAGMAALRAGEVLQAEALAAMRDELDERAWGVQDREGDTSEHLRAFRQARAVDALLCASADDPRAALAEAIYEAMHATDAGSDVLGAATALLLAPGGRA